MGFLSGEAGCLIALEDRLLVGGHGRSALGNDATVSTAGGILHNRFQRSPSVVLATLGCKVNQCETDQMAGEFVDLGFRLASAGEAADVYVINTCTVTHIADRKSRQLIRQAKAKNAKGLVVVTGCYASVSASEVAALPEVDLVIPKGDQHRLIPLVAAALGESSSDDTGPQVARLVADRRRRNRTRAFVKIQDGCDDQCTYCIVPAARGKSRSIPSSQVIAEVEARLAAGYKEIVLAGVHIGRYGADWAASSQAEPFGDLAGLVRHILEATAVPRLRLTSVEPMDFGPNLLDLWRDERLARHVHLPLQSGASATLRRMGRRYSPSDFADLVAAIRAAVPGMAITTDIITGFPGENDAEFAESLQFVESLNFSKVHVFPFSPRRGTPAAQMSGQIPSGQKKWRSEAMRSAGERGATAFRRQFIGSTLPVLFETADGLQGAEMWTGLTDNYLRVAAASETDLANSIRAVRLTADCNDCLYGEIAE